MCLVIFAHRVSAELPLVVAANRDEFHARPTAPASFWPGRPNLLAGRDQQAGGTWMGITGSGRFAAITNVQDPSRTAPAPRSRGELTLDFLTDAKPAEDYLGQTVTEAVITQVEFHFYPGTSVVEGRVHAHTAARTCVP